MIIVMGSVVAQQGRYAQALALSQEHVARSRAEPGCLAHAVHADTENPLRLVFIEQWASALALWDHFKVPASRAFAQAITALAQGQPTMAVYDASTLAVPGRGGG